jgi:hypothetical protein
MGRLGAADFIAIVEEVDIGSLRHIIGSEF